MNDPDEICVNCGGLVVSYHKICPWCGKVWWNGRVKGQVKAVAERVGDVPLADGTGDRSKQVKHLIMDSRGDNA